MAPGRKSYAIGKAPGLVGTQSYGTQPAGLEEKAAFQVNRNPVFQKPVKPVSGFPVKPKTGFRFSISRQNRFESGYRDGRIVSAGPSAAETNYLGGNLAMEEIGGGT